MRGEDSRQEAKFSCVTLEQRVPTEHPTRKIRALVDRALERVEPVLAVLYVERGRPSIAPERLLQAQLLMSLYSIRSESQLMEQLNERGICLSRHSVLFLRLVRYPMSALALSPPP